MTGDGRVLDAYVPRFASEWDHDAPDRTWRVLDASLCFVDISGFTNLSERLARRGRVGAEELTAVLDRVFSDMLGIAYEKGGVLLKFGGDALLLAFDHDDHPRLATEAAVAMRAALRRARTIPTSVGRLNLRMSVGVHSGPCHLFRAGVSHRELVVCGPGATTVTRMEHTADANEIVVSAATAARLTARAVGARAGDGFLLRTRAVVAGGPGPVQRAPVDAERLRALLPAALRDHLGARIDAEHRIATVAFVRYEPVDELLERDGADAFAAAIDALVGNVQSAVDDEGVTFLATDVDENAGKIILVSGIPRAGDDDDGRMLRAVRRIADASAGAPLQLRIGVNRGHVFAGAIGTEFRRTFTVMGDTVNLAARLMAACPPGAVLATAGVLDGSATLFETEALPPMQVKGKTEAVQAYTVGAAVGARRARTSSLPFVGRDEELAALMGAVAEANAGGVGAVAVVEGERGAGKTRLVDELRRATADATVLELDGESYAAATPYVPFREPLRRLLGLEAIEDADAAQHVAELVERDAPVLAGDAPLLAPVLGVALRTTPETDAIAPAFRRERLARVVVELLDALATPPLLLVLEDAHWFDDASTFLAQRLADAAATRPWVVCVTRRPEQAGFEPTRVDVPITLSPLDDTAAARLIDSATDATPLRPQERDQLVARAAGNPLFIEELVTVARQRGFDALPDSLDVLASVELDALPPIARRIVREASVLGRAFDWALLLDVLGADADALDDATRRNVERFLVPDGDGRARFRHALLQEAAYESLPFSVRARLHRLAGAAIERSAVAPDDAAPLLSLHFSRAHDWERAWKYGRLAAARAQAAYAPGEVATHLEIALAAARRLPDVTAAAVASVLEDLGEARIYLGTYDEADHAFRRAAQTLGDDPVGRARMLERRSFVQGEYQGRLTTALRQARAGLALVDPDGSTDAARVATRLRSREAEMRFLQGRLAEAARICGEVMVAAERLGEQRALATAMTVLDACLFEMGHPEQATHMKHVLALYEALGDRLGVAATLSNLGATAYFESRWHDAADAWAKAFDAALQAGDTALSAMTHANLAELRINQGRLEEAETLVTPARRTLESFGFMGNIAFAVLQLGRVRAFLGRVPDGVGLIDRAVAMYEDIGSQAGALEGRARLAEVQTFARDVSAAARALDHARADARGLGETHLEVLLDRVSVTLATVEGDETRAQKELESALAHARDARADYDVLMLLTLADRLGTHNGIDERAELADRLGVVTLAVLP